MNEILDKEKQESLSRGLLVCADNVSLVAQQSLQRVTNLIEAEFREGSFTSIKYTLTSNLHRLKEGILSEFATVRRTAVSAIESESVRRYNESRQRQRPSFLLQPALEQVDGKWHARYGVNGPVGIGNSPQEAFDAFDEAWTTKVP